MKIVVLLSIVSTSFVMAGAYEEHIGRNTQGDTIYANATICRNASGICERFKTSFERPLLKKLSGNFVVLNNYYSGQYQVADTVTGKRFNIRNCNGPYMVALNETHALINDCGGHEKALINMETGERSYSQYWINDHAFFTSHGTIIRESSALKLVNATGNMLWEVHGISDLAEVSPVGDHSIAIKSLNEVLIVDLKSGKKTAICPGINVLSLDVRYYDTETHVVCSGEQSDGTEVIEEHSIKVQF